MSSAAVDHQPASSASKADAKKPELKKESTSTSSSSTSINKDKSKSASVTVKKESTNGTAKETNGSSANNKSASKSDSSTKIKAEPQSKSFSEADAKKKDKPNPTANKSSSSSSDKQPAKKIKTEPDTPAPKKANGSTNGSTPKSTSNGNKTPSSSSSKTAKTETKSPAVKSESKTPVKPESKTPSKPAASSAKSTPSSSSKSKSQENKSSKKRSAEETPTQESPKKRKKKDEEEEEVWRWWEEKKYADGRKWTTLDHKGPVFDPGYTPLPDNIHFFYNNERMKLSVEAEEVMTFYAKMLDHDYTKKDVFNANFFNDWRKFMSDAERTKIKDLKKCDFAKVFDYFKKISEERKLMTKEEKKAIKEENLKIKKEFGFCMWDGHKQPIGNYKIEPPGLFRGRGEHPKMGMVKKRTNPEDVIINCGKEAKVPQPPPGHKWKEVRHDNMVAWLCSWSENVQGNTKYVMLNAASRVKGERDWQKYEKARKLHRVIDKLRHSYIEDWKSKEMKVRQRAVAIYFIDKLALRAGNEKDEDEADTVGCCSLRVEHIKLHKDVEGVGEHVVEFDFLGKDSIRYQNKVAVEKQVYKNLTLFVENKNPDDELFDRLNVSQSFLFFFVSFIFF